jgi:hypothetical protein
MSFKNRTTGNNWTNSSNALFQAWVQFLSNGLQSGGCTKTADTGQVNTATVTAPGATNTSQGYEIRQFTDTLAGSSPVVFKIEYGSGGTATTPAIWITVGTGSDGAGGITGIKWARTQLTPTGPAASAAFAISVDTNRFTFGLHYLSGTASTGLFVGLERSKSAAGADNADGALYVGGLTNGTTNIAFLPFAGSIPASETAGTCLIPVSGTTSAGADVGTWPVPHFWFGYTVYPGHNWLGYRATEILQDAVQSVTLYDALAHDFLPIGVTNAPAVFAINRNSNCVMMRYE